MTCNSEKEDCSLQDQSEHHLLLPREYAVVQLYESVQRNHKETNVQGDLHDRWERGGGMSSPTWQARMDHHLHSRVKRGSADAAGKGREGRAPWYFVQCSEMLRALRQKR